MPNSSIITAFRDALYRNVPVNKNAFIQQVEATSMTKNQKLLSIEELNLIEWEYTGGYTEAELIAMQNRLNALSLNESSSASRASSTDSMRWEKLQAVKQLTVDSLSQFSRTISSGKSSEEIKKENLLKKAELLLDKLHEKQRQANQPTFQELEAMFNDELSDVASLTHYLILFRQACRDKKGRIASTDDYVNNLLRKLQVLTDEELKIFYAKMHSEAMVRFINALFTQNYILDNDLSSTEHDIILEQENNIAFNDAVSILPMNMGWMKAQIISRASKESAKMEFLKTASQLHSFMLGLYDQVSYVMKERKLLEKKRSDDYPFYESWPRDEQGAKPIIINSNEKHLVNESVKALYTGLSAPSPKGETLDVFYFSKMVRSFGVGFNPNRFCDLILRLDPASIQDRVAQYEPERLNSLYKAFQSTDLNNLMLLLKMIKDGDKGTRDKLYPWLSITASHENLDEPLQILAKKLYESGEMFMQSVRQRLSKERDYDYNNLELSAERVYTYKNAACIKRLLDIHNIAFPQKDFSYGVIDNFYYMLYPGVQDKKVSYEEQEELLTRVVTSPFTAFITRHNDEYFAKMVGVVS